MLIITHCDAAQCSLDSISSQPPLELGDLLASIRQDGVKDITIFKQLVGGPVGTYEVYELGATGLEKTTPKHAVWVQSRLEKQKSEVLLRATTDLEREIWSAASEYAIALFNDKIGATRNSLLKHALKWSRSDNQALQYLAVLALRQGAGGPLRNQVLQELRKSGKAKLMLDEAHPVLESDK